MSRSVCALAIALAGFAAGPAASETLEVVGIYGARAEIPPEIEVIAIEPFDGEWGYELRDAVTDILSAPVAGGAPFFRVIPEVFAGRGDIQTDASLRGAAHVWVAERPASPRVHKECVERDDKGKCVAKEEIRIPCWEMRVTYDARTALIGRDGARLADRGDLLQTSRTFCEDEWLEPDPDALLDELATRYAASLVGEFTPRREVSATRLLEQRKGLAKGDRRTFKRALKLTKSDPRAACQTFSQLEDANPGHVSVLFNIGLCHESANRLDEAERYYDRALDAAPDKSYPVEGLARIASRRRGAAQLTARGRNVAEY